MGKLIGILFSLVIVAAVAAGAGWFWINSSFTADGPATTDGKPRVVMIERGSTTQAIATKLKEVGAIADDGLFRLALRVREILGDKPVMKAGEYEIATWTCAAPAGATLAADDVAQWIDSVQAQIHPGACGRITCAGRDCSVGIRWDDSRATGGSDTQAFEIRSRL